MKKKTYNNILKAARLIRKKGYNEKESLEIAIKCFDNMESANNGMPVEWFVDMIVEKSEK